MTSGLQMTALSLCRQFETNLTSNRKVIEVILQLKIPKARKTIQKSYRTTPGPRSFAALILKLNEARGPAGPFN